MTRPTPRRPSRTTTPRPRKIAGRDEVPVETQAPAEGEGGTEATPTKPGPAAPTPPPPPRPPRRPVAKEPDDEGNGRTSTLLAVLGVLVLVLVLQCAWFVWNAVRDVELAAVSTSAQDDNGGEDYEPIAVPSDRPVVLNQLAVQEGVDAAAAAAQIMFARNWESYDDGVDNAVGLMTEEFGEEFRATTEDVKREFVRKKTEVQVRVVAQSVVRANDTELEALVFLNQYVFRGEGEDAKSTYTPYRALLRMVHTDTGWLVDGVTTK